MDRQTLRDWVIRFNEQGPDGLINIPSPGAPPKLDDTHKAFLRRIVARPKAYKQDADAMAAFKKTLPYAWRKSARHSRLARQ